MTAYELQGKATLARQSLAAAASSSSSSESAGEWFTVSDTLGALADGSHQNDVQIVSIRADDGASLGNGGTFQLSLSYGGLNDFDRESDGPTASGGQQIEQATVTAPIAYDASAS